MKKRGSRYFDGYVYEDATEGAGRGKLVYRAEWYGFCGGPAVAKKMKLCCCALSAVMAGSYLYAQLSPADGGMNRFVALVSILALLPMIPLFMGLVNFLFAGKKWELRTYYSGYRRLWRSSVALAITLCLWLAAELVFIILHPASLLSELRYTAAACVSAAAMTAQALLIRKTPATVIERPEIK